MQQGYMLDTNVFNYLLKEIQLPKICHSALLLATHIQMDEIAATKDCEKKAHLTRVFEEVNPEREATASFVLGVSRLDKACLGRENGRYDEMLNLLKGLDLIAKKKSRNPYNQHMDILIAETAMQRRATLVSNDVSLQQVMNKFGGYAMDAASFWKVVALQLIPEHKSGD